MKKAKQQIAWAQAKLIFFSDQGLITTITITLGRARKIGKVMRVTLLGITKWSLGTWNLEP